MSNMNNIAQIEITPEYLASQGLSKTFALRFFNKFRKTDGCWVWLGCKSFGYGKLARGKIANGKKRPIWAHRASWILYRGPVPDGMWVLHHCDNRACVNPDHLFLGRAKDNTQDMMNKGRGGHGCCSGEAAYNHKLTDNRVRLIRASVGVRQRTLAAQFGVNQKVIWCVIHRRNWRHI